MKTDNVPTFLNIGNTYETKEFKSPEGTLRIRSAESPEDIWQSEELWRSAAERGEGFGMDEFEDTGYFHRKFFRESNILVVEDTAGKIHATSIFGPSTLSRAVKTVLATNYVAVDKSSVKLKIGQTLLEHSLKILKNEGYKGIISDTYIENHKMLRLLKKLNFGFRGSLPQCAYIKGYGPSDSLIVYKDL